MKDLSKPPRRRSRAPSLLLGLAAIGATATAFCCNHNNRGAPIVTTSTAFAMAPLSSDVSSRRGSKSSHSGSSGASITRLMAVTTKPSSSSSVKGLHFHPQQQHSVPSPQQLYQKQQFQPLQQQRHQSVSVGLGGGGVKSSSNSNSKHNQGGGGGGGGGSVRVGAATLGASATEAVWHGDVSASLRESGTSSTTTLELPVEGDRRSDLLKEAYEECKRITSIYAKTFYMGTSFLDYEKRSATWAIYVWCRRTDDIVDSPRAIVEKTMNDDLEQWSRRLEDIWRGKPWDSLDAALCDVRDRYPSMGIEPYKDMVKGMVMDVPGVGQSRYQTFEDLYLYCYRVAGTVGLMTLPIMGTAPGYTEKQATEPALALGIALQLTNILRDVGEDALRGRIYLPLEDLERFGVTEDQIMNKIMNSNYRELIKFQIARARKYFDRAEVGIKMLAPDARLPVRSSLDMYRKILNVIEHNDYDNFRKRAYVGKLEKVLTLPMSWLKTLE